MKRNESNWISNHAVKQIVFVLSICHSINPMSINCSLVFISTPSFPWISMNTMRFQLRSFPSFCRCWKPGAAIPRENLQASRWCGSGRTGRPKAWMCRCWKNDMISGSWVELFERLRVILLYCTNILLYTISYIHHLLYTNIFVIFSTKSFRLHRFSEGTTTFQAGHHWTLTLIQQALKRCFQNKKHRGRKKPLEERPFCVDVVWIPLTWFWSDKAISNNPEMACKTWRIHVS